MTQVPIRLCLVLAALSVSGCATVDPGHLGLMFNSRTRELTREPLPPGLYFTGLFGSVKDYDITFSTKTEEIETASSEGLALTLRIAVAYRPVVSELHDLLADIGLNYYDEVIGPEFRSAARGVFARHSYLELLRQNEQIEDQIEADLRRRTSGKHIEISSITMESIRYAPEIGKAVQDKLVAEQDAFRQKTLLENQASRQRLELESQSEQARMRAESALKEKQQETELAKMQGNLDTLRAKADAEKGLIRARAQAEEGKVKATAQAEELKVLAHAHAEENKALTPLAVMLKGYEAMETLGKGDAHIMLGDWSKVPNFLFPPAFSPLLGKPSTAAATP